MDDHSVPHAWESSLCLSFPPFVLYLAQSFGHFQFAPLDISYTRRLVGDYAV